MKDAALGFVGLGVMGSPMCRNLARRSRRPVIGFDLKTNPPEGVLAADSVRDLASRVDTIFLSLPGEPEIREVLRDVPEHKTVVDCSTAPVALARELAARYANFADAPVARTRQAAIDGSLSIMVGASRELYARIEPLLSCMGSEVTHCGPPGAGQAVKLMNNMVLSITVAALAEALAVAKASGAVDAKLLFETLAKGSADSFALRNHGLKALLPESHPHDAFSTRYMLKDMTYALELARSAGLQLQAAGTAHRLLEETVALGLGDAYHTAIVEAVRRHR